MVQIHLPYGKTGMTANIPEENFSGVFESSTPDPAEDQEQEVIRALDNPIGSIPLEKMAENKKSCVIIASDHTRPVPSRYIIPEMLRRLRKGSPDIDITILIATGFHRKTTRSELVAKFGEDIVENEKIVVHDSGDSSTHCKLGTLPSGGELVVNKLAVEADLLVSEGFIEPHFFAGFSGGRKSILPGIAARETVLANHCAEFINHPCSRTGILENNPIHRDMLFAARAAKLAFIVNVVINRDKKVVKAFAGDPEAAHASGCSFLDRCCRIAVPESDIVITTNGGYPLDQNVYQSVKGMTAAEAVCKENGVIIIATSCCDGHGGESFYKMLSEAESPETLLEEIAEVPRNATIPDQWQYQILCRILSKFKVIVVTRDCDHKMIEDMKMIAAGNMDEAITLALKYTSPNAKITVIPDGVSVVTARL